MSFIELIDLSRLMPIRWSQSIEATSKSFGTRVITDGSLSSRTDLTKHGTNYTVVHGDQIVRHLRWLDDLYRGPLLELVSDLLGLRLYPALSTKYGLNINTVDVEGAGYEWHFDSNPVTVVLFASSLPPRAGGQLLLKTTEGVDISIPPIKGFAVVFSGDVLEHSVAPLRLERVRISIPFSYFFDAKQLVSDELQDYLYGKESNG